MWHYGTVIYYGKTMVIWPKLRYYGKNYDTIPRTIEFRFTKDKKRGRLPKNTKL